MSRFATVLKLFLLPLTLLASPLCTQAETAADAKGLPQQEFIKSIEVYDIKLEPHEKELLFDFIQNTSKEQQAKLGTLRDNLRNNDARILLRNILMLMDQDGSRAIFAKLADHQDPLLQLVSNLQLAGGGSSDAAQKIYRLIHSEEPSPLQKRYLKTWCAGVGIHAESDTAEQIYGHLMTVMSQTAKWKPGDSAPDFHVQDTKGTTLSLKDLRGKVVLLHFWATSCGPCMAGLPALKKELNAYPADELVVISVSLDDDRKAFDDAVKQNELPWHNVFDGAGWGGSLARTYGINRMPFDVIIDATGKIRSNETRDIPQLLAKPTIPKREELKGGNKGH